MIFPVLRRTIVVGVLTIAALLLATASPAHAQQPTTDSTRSSQTQSTGTDTGTGQFDLPKLPPGMTPDQGLQLLRSRPDLAQQVRDRIAQSGLTPDQIRARLRAQGYPEDLLDDYLTGADTTRKVRPGANTIEALRGLGVVSATDADSLRQFTDSALKVADSLRTDSLSERRRDLRIFGLDVFRRSTTQFQPASQGPVGENYRLGVGDVLVLVLSGDVEDASTLEVNRDGFVVIPRLGQLYVANLTMAQLQSLLYERLGRIYSGVRRTNPTTKFQVTVSRLRQIQVYVAGDVARPGAVLMSSAGSVLTALYQAGGPSERGSFRSVLVRRGTQLVDSLDLYDYLLHGRTPGSANLQTGDIIFVPPAASHVKVTGAIVRPAIYELRAGETLKDLLADAGGFAANALRTRVQIHRIVPPASRTSDGRDRVVLDVASDRFATGDGPEFPMAAGDSVNVFHVRDRVRDVLTVKGNVWVEGKIGFAPGMKLSDALLLAGGVKPDTYLGSVLVSRLRPDSTRVQLRSSFADSTGRLTEDLPLQEDDEINVFSRSSFRPRRYVVVTGAVRRGGRVPYQEGMTLRDALLQVDGVTEDALLTEAEIARLPENRQAGEIARTFRVPLDSTYLFDRGAKGEYQGPPGLAAQRSGAPETVLQPYDNVLILRQPEWELQRPVVILGQVRFPGRYGLRSRTERMTDLLERAGGLTKEAYAAGIEFYRNQGRQGRIGVDLPRVLRDGRFRDNLILVSGDSVIIPEYNPVVRVNGAVNAPVAVAYVPGKSARFYVDAAGGFSRIADKRRTYVTQPSGKVESGRGRKPLPGAVVFVPQRDPNDKGSLPQILAVVSPLVAAIATILVVKLAR